MFCKYCGKEIPEGQTCECRTAPAAPVEVQPVAEAPVETAAAPAAASVAAPAAPAAGNDIGKIIGDAFKGMPAAAKTLLGNTYGAGIDMPSAVVFAVGGLVLHILAWLCVVGGLMGMLKDAIMTMAGGLGGVEVMTTVNQYIDIMFKGINGMAVWAGCLSYAVPLIIAVAIPSVGQLIRKEKVDLVHNFICGASVGVLPAVIFLVGGLLSLMSFGLGAVLMVVAVMYGIVISYKLLAKQMKNTTSAVGGLIITVALTVIIALAAWIVSGAVTGYFEGDFVKNLANIGADISDLGEIFEYFM